MMPLHSARSIPTFFGKKNVGMGLALALVIPLGKNALFGFSSSFYLILGICCGAMV